MTPGWGRGHVLTMRCRSAGKLAAGLRRLFVLRAAECIALAVPVAVRDRDGLVDGMPFLLRGLFLRLEDRVLRLLRRMLGLLLRLVCGDRRMLVAAEVAPVVETRLVRVRVLAVRDGGRDGPRRRGPRNAGDRRRRRRVDDDRRAVPNEPFCMHDGVHRGERSATDRGRRRDDSRDLRGCDGTGGRTSASAAEERSKRCRQRNRAERLERRAGSALSARERRALRALAQVRAQLALLAAREAAVELLRDRELRLAARQRAFQ